MPKQEATTRFTTQRWFESNDYGKETFVDELLASHGSLLAALEKWVLFHGNLVAFFKKHGPQSEEDIWNEARAVIAQAKVAS